MDKTKNSSNTPYDDVYRTLLNDCSTLIIPVVNEAFQRNHSKTEKIILRNNELFVTEQNGKHQKIITDTNFTLGSIRYHLECQSTEDDTMLLRVFEYDSDNVKLQELSKAYEEILGRLNQCVKEHKITEYTKHTIIDMSKKVLEQIAAKYSHVKERVGDLMGGKILNYEAKDILNAGRAAELLENILDFLTELGDIPERLRETILAENDLDVLKRWLKLSAKSKTIEEFQDKM